MSLNSLAHSLRRRLPARHVRPSVVALAVAAAALASTSGLQASDERHDQTPSTIVFTIDVAEDFTWFADADGKNLCGAFFVTEGRIFPAGTIPKGGTPEAPNSFDPNGTGAVGTWFCRGTHLVSGALFPVTARAVHTGQLYLMPPEARHVRHTPPTRQADPLLRRDHAGRFGVRLFHKEPV